jgi:DNA repair exonuclease SbcCD nuclease subunit
MNHLKFAHLADLHLGGFREKRLTNLNFITFKKAIDTILEKNLDFVLFAGDIFNNAMPNIELVEQVIHQFNRLKKENIPIYVIGGSHDYSNSGKSFLSLLDAAGVFIDVCKYKFIDKNKVELIFTKNEKLKINLAGILGKKNGLDKNFYTNLNDISLPKDYLNIFLFHTTIDNFKPSHLSQIKSEVKKEFLPIGFDYYAGGHIHHPMIGNYNGSPISYSGALFPNNFSEMKSETPGFNICEFNREKQELKIKREELNTYEKEYIKFEFDTISALDAKDKILNKLNKLNYKNKILLLEFSGIIEGKIIDIEINKCIKQAYENGALFILKNTYKLSTTSTININIDEIEDNEKIEEQIIQESLNESLTKDIDFKYILQLLKLNLEKQEGEKVAQFEDRIIEAFEKSLNNTTEK